MTQRLLWPLTDVAEILDLYQRGRASTVGRVASALTKRSDAVLAGEDGPRSHAHLYYVGLEVTKLVALISGGVAALVTA